MSKNIRTQVGKVVGKSLNAYHQKIKPTVDDIKFKEQYQGRIIDCMVGEVDDNYIETPPTDAPIVKLENSREGLVKVPTIKGKTILVDADGNETDTPAEGCKLISVGEEEDNKLIILSKNKNLLNSELEIGVWKTTDGTENNSATTSLRTKDFIRIENIEHTVLRYDNGAGVQICLYDKNFKFVSARSYSSGKYVRYEGTDENVLYAKMNFLNTLDKDGQFALIIGRYTDSNAPSYIKPKHHKTEILFNEPLRSLPNGVCDERVDNRLIIRVGVLDTVSNFRKNGVYDGTKGSRFVIQLKSAKQIQNSIVASNYIPFKQVDSSWREEGYYIATDEFGANDSLNIRLNEDLTLEEFKNKFRDLVIYYELEEPIIEELPNGITLQGFDDTTMYLESSITPTVTYGYNALIPFKEEIKIQKEEVEFNTSDIEENIIPYLMDVEFNLMMMEDK